MNWPWTTLGSKLGIGNQQKWLVISQPGNNNIENETISLSPHKILYESHFVFISNNTNQRWLQCREILFSSISYKNLDSHITFSVQHRTLAENVQTNVCTCKDKEHNWENTRRIYEIAQIRTHSDIREVLREESYFSYNSLSEYMTYELILDRK